MKKYKSWLTKSYEAFRFGLAAKLQLNKTRNKMEGTRISVKTDARVSPSFYFGRFGTVVKPKGNQSISCAEAGRQGGLATLARHGVEHFRHVGTKGQAILSQRYSTKQRKLWGKKGGRPRKPLVELGEEKNSCQEVWEPARSSEYFSSHPAIANLTEDRCQ